MENPMKSLFLLDPNIHFLNHGSFGACPRKVFENYQDWQMRLEKQPVLFLGRQIADYLSEARTILGEFLNTNRNNLVFISNATQGVNIAARSMLLAPGDEILTSDHEYGACDFTWEHICKKSGAIYRHQRISLPVTSVDEIVEQFWSGVNARTRVIFLSHITSPTALRLPVEKICARAREKGIVTIIDGAHAPGQINLDLDQIGADWYIGNLHKWALSPKGAAFLYVNHVLHESVEPLIVSWGYHSDREKKLETRLQDLYGWTGTRDPSMFLAVPAALEFMNEHHWHIVQSDCHQMLSSCLKQLSELTQFPPLYHLDQNSSSPENIYFQMGAAQIPGEIQTSKLKEFLYNEYSIEVPVIEWNGMKLLRISIQAYNQVEDVDVLLEGMKKYIERHI